MIFAWKTQHAEAPHKPIPAPNMAAERIAKCPF